MAQTMIKAVTLVRITRKELRYQGEGEEQLLWVVREGFELKVLIKCGSTFIVGFDNNANRGHIGRVHERPMQGIQQQNFAVSPSLKKDIDR